MRRESPTGRPEGELRSAKHEGNPGNPKGHPQGERRSAKHEGNVICIALLCALIVCALSLVTSRHQARRLTVELEREVQRARQFDVEFGQLSLEQSTWGMPARVEKIARESLRMQLPASSRVEVVEATREPPK
jgi:cell division protein FtsL